MYYEQRKSWEDIWKAQKNTLVSKDIFYLIDEIKLSYLLPLLPKAGKTIEVGSGSGRLSCFLASHGYETTCLDYSTEALRVAKENYKLANLKGKFVLGDAFYLPFPDYTFDIIFSTGLLEHFENPQPIVSEMVRVLKNTGLFYSDIVPKKFSLLRSLDFFSKQRGAKRNCFEGKFKKKDIEKLLSNSGLTNIKIFSAGVFPPQLPILRRYKTFRECEFKILNNTKKIWKAFDRTKLSDWLGFYYFTYGYKFCR